MAEEAEEEALSHLLTPIGMICGLAGVIIKALADSSLIGIVKNWALSARPGPGIGFPTLRGDEGQSIFIQCGVVFSWLGWSLIAIGFVAQLIAWWGSARQKAS